MVKHTQTIRRLLLKNCLSVLGHFVKWLVCGSTTENVLIIWLRCTNVLYRTPWLKILSLFCVGLLDPEVVFTRGFVIFLSLANYVINEKPHKNLSLELWRRVSTFNSMNCNFAVFWQNCHSLLHDNIPGNLQFYRLCGSHLHCFFFKFFFIFCSVGYALCRKMKTDF